MPDQVGHDDNNYMTLINKFSEFRTDYKFLVVTCLYTAYDLCIYPETLRDLDDLFSMLR